MLSLLSILGVLAISDPAAAVGSQGAADPDPAPPVQRPAQYVEVEPNAPLPVTAIVPEVEVGPPVQVHQPAHGMQIDELSGPGYRLSAREWNEVVRGDPHLLRMHRLGGLLPPGIVMAAIGGSALSLSIALQADFGRPESFTGRYFAVFLPAALLAAGIPMIAVGATNRRRLRLARAEMLAVPTATRYSAGLGLVGRF